MDNYELNEVEQHSDLSKYALNKLKRYYLLALSIIFITILFSQLLIFNHLNKQLNDSRVINIAGRQRMLSQKIVKDLYRIASIDDKLSSKEYKKNLHSSLDLWESSHFALKARSSSMQLEGENSKVVQQKFHEIQPIFDDLLKLFEGAISNPDSIQMSPIHKLSDDFLLKMDAIVFAMDKDASQRISTLRKLEISFLLISLLVLFLEVVFIFRPAANYASDIIFKLIKAEDGALILAKQNNKLYKDLEASTEELRAMNYALDQTSLFASLDNTGKIKYLSDKFKKLMGIKDDAHGKKIQHFLAKSPTEVERLENVFKNMKSSIWNDELEIVVENKISLFLDIRVVPVYRFGMRYELFILCTDITKRVLATRELSALIKDRYENEIKEQKLRSSQILNAQEEERKRIARDMHDGIGQMLTALKFNIEALNYSEMDANKNQLLEINKLAKNIIKEVRTTTFNLTPPELSDYGIEAGIKKMATQLQNLTGQKIQVNSDVTNEMRFESSIEINLYRIVQEAVNNALKYGNGSIILIKINKTSDMLSISIIDDGQGFNIEESQMSLKSGGGNGLVNMKERASMINGRLFISSEPGSGTRITINLPIDNSI